MLTPHGQYGISMRYFSRCGEVVVVGKKGKMGDDNDGENDNGGENDNSGENDNGEDLRTAAIEEER